MALHDVVFYLDCEEIEIKLFTVSNAGINFLSILGEIEWNTTTLDYSNFFDVSWSDKDRVVVVYSKYMRHAISHYL